jgi:hypothetical protein
VFWLLLLLFIKESPSMYRLYCSPYINIHDAICWTLHELLRLRCMASIEVPVFKREYEKLMFRRTLIPPPYTSSLLQSRISSWVLCRYRYCKMAEISSSFLEVQRKWCSQYTCKCINYKGRYWVISLVVVWFSVPVPSKDYAAYFMHSVSTLSVLFDVCNMLPPSGN